MLPCDLRDRAAVVKLAEEAEKALGQVDILVNNAGITHDNLFMRMKDEEWDDVIAVNLTSVFVLTRGILRGMMRRRAGRIVNIASISGVLGNPGQGNYAASKAGLVGMTKSLAREVSSRGITANCIAPGFISTPMTDALTPKQVEAIAAAIPAARIRQTGGCRGGGGLPGKRRGGLRHRRDGACEWRHGYGLSRFAAKTWRMTSAVLAGSHRPASGLLAKARKVCYPNGRSVRLYGGLTKTILLAFKPCELAALGCVRP